MRFFKGFGIWLGCILLLTSGVFADAVQDSLFEKALDAEAAGDVVQTIALLEQANARPGKYNDEIQQILADYYEALGVMDTLKNGEKKESEKNWRLLSRLELVGFKYKEFGDTLGADEYSGEGYLQVGGEFELRRGNLSHIFTMGFAVDGFLREDETVFDTSRWALTPSLEYTLQGERFLASLGGEVNISERDGAVFAGTVSGERDFYQAGDFRAGVSGFGFANDMGRSRLKLGGYAEYRPRTGFWTNVALMGRMDRDTSVSAYYWQYERNWDSPDSTNNFDLNRFGGGFGEDPRSFTVDSTQIRYYYGSNIKLGPELDLQLGFRINSLFSLDFFGYLFWSYNPEEDEWLTLAGPEDGAEWETVTWNCQILQGSARIRGNLKFEKFGTYLSVGTYFRRYLDLPEDHPEIYSYAYILGEVRLGATFRF